MYDLRVLREETADEFRARWIENTPIRVHADAIAARLSLSPSLLAETATAGATSAAAIAATPVPLGSAGFDPDGWWRSIYGKPMVISRIGASHDRERSGTGRKGEKRRPRAKRERTSRSS